MNLDINKDFRITSDPMQFILQERRERQDGNKKGEEYWNTIGYYSSLETALNDYKTYRIKVSDADGYKQIIELLEKLEKEIKTISRGL